MPTFYFLQRTELGRTLMAIDNIAEKCRRKLDKSLDRMSLEQKLDVIKVSDLIRKYIYIYI